MDYIFEELLGGDRLEQQPELCNEIDCRLVKIILSNVSNRTRRKFAFEAFEKFVGRFGVRNGNMAEQYATRKATSLRGGPSQMQRKVLRHFPLQTTNLHAPRHATSSIGQGRVSSSSDENEQPGANRKISVKAQKK
ncbi:hypothetical protein JTB14_010036 [Gonioctena quinquepunctata]|nr:hypothetical protein JTB14_010036 [Gonioctena quinquepunctata]